jgi:hypothetical protein
MVWVEYVLTAYGLDWSRSRFGTIWAGNGLGMSYAGHGLRWSSAELDVGCSGHGLCREMSGLIICWARNAGLRIVPAGNCEDFSWFLLGMNLAGLSMDCCELGTC